MNTTIAVGYIAEPSGYPDWTEERRRQIAAAAQRLADLPSQHQMQVLYDLLHDSGRA